MKDTDGTSVCYDDCQSNWPVFYSQGLYLPEGLDRNDFGSFERTEGNMHLTYKGWPLYYFVNDASPGHINGDGINDIWFVAKPDYTIMLTVNQLTGNDGINYTGDYQPGDEVFQFFTDAEGVTLYTSVNDYFLENMFTKEDFTNNDLWPVYEVDNIIVPSSLEASDFEIIDVYGTSQLTYKGWPLYYYGADDLMRGSTKGVSVPVPGVWPVAEAGFESALYSTIVDVVVKSSDHEILEAAVVAADLAGTLSGEGPFTVFAPTDAAFDALPEGALDALLDDPAGELTNILLYHVISRKAMSTDLFDGQIFTTLFEQDTEVSITDSGVMINNAKVTVADIEAGNGVVHVIDAILLPEEETTGIFSVRETLEFSFYPNPAREFIMVNSSVDIEKSAIMDFIDITGKKIYEAQIDEIASRRIKLTNMNPGIYFVRLIAGNKEGVKKLIVK
jgi:uncharacterized surface protein with fasciclin (FAS1) repeats/predicted lipoprotein with Yx(FWY)xxD motif